MSNARFILQVHVGTFSTFYEALSIEASKQTISDEIVSCVVEKLGLKYPQNYELAEVVYDANGQDCKERRLGGTESPVALQLLWPRPTSLVECDREFQAPQYRFCLRQKFSDSARHGLLWPDSTDHKLIQEYFLRFLYQPRDKEYTDLCQLPNLTEQTLLENLKVRFEKGHIYTYVGSILIAVNPFRFYPIYNPKYVKLYQNHQLGDLPPHIFAIADAGYQLMLRQRKNQCIVISGESGSGKTESTHLLLHHLTALSQKGTHGSGVEQTILSASPVLEAFGNAKTKHNNNSSRFGKFIQVNYKENGQVHGALVQKYLLEKSRIISQSKNERNYHVFYYMLEGANDAERNLFHLHQSKDYYYLNQSDCFKVEGVDEAYEFNRLKQSMEMVGFTPDKQKGLLGILSAVLHLGNVEFSKKSNYYSDEVVVINNPATVSIISQLLGVKEETLNSALTCKHVKTRGETLIFHYKMPEAIATRDAMAKCLYSALFDWIVMQVNHALLAKQDAREHKGNSIGVLDIFGFEDFGSHNSFEQFCINFANEHLQYYFNQHVFKYEQEEYEREGIQWKNIEFKDNTGCLELIEGRPHGLLCLLDDQCSFPGATDATLQQKFENHYRNNEFYELPQCKENSFFVKHYAGKVKYQIKDFREKNLELMRPYFVLLLKSSSFTLVRELVGTDPVAVFRWAILRAFFRAHFAFLKLHQSATDPKNSKLNKMKENCLRQNRKNSSTNSNQYEKSTRNPLSTVQTLSLQSPNKTCNKEYGICSLHSLEAVLCASEAKVLERANQIMLKSKSSKKTKHQKTLSNLKTMKALMGKSHYCGHRTAKKQSPTVSAQFQTSLNQLMETLNHANPFFVRCIKSNAEKIPNCFDDAMILRQLRYTGMLETVRIRQSGYSVRLTFEEFIQRYRILLPKGLLSSQLDISNFLTNMSLNEDNYQMGKTKVFFRESEKLKLDECLHQTILHHIVILQRWVRTWLIHRRFKRMKVAAIILQKNIRRYLAQQKLINMKLQILAALCIQRVWRGYRIRKWYRKLQRGCIVIQAACRGYLNRKKYQYLWENHQKQRASLQENSQKAIIVRPRRAMSASLLDNPNQFDWNVKSYLVTKTKPEVFQRQQSKDSDGSSGIHEDSEPESLASESTGSALHSPPPSPLVEGPSSLPVNYVKQNRRNRKERYIEICSLDGRLCICYKDLIDNFEQVMQSVCHQENTSQTFPVIMGVNAFRGFLDEFRNLYRNEEKIKSKGKKRKRKKMELSEYMGHKFMAVVINIPTACEICSSFMWLMEKGLVCQGCKLTCHKKCYTKVNVYCKNCLSQHEKRVFGAPLEYLVSSEIRIPIVVERLITVIELKGLYTEGIYRKSGIASKVRKLKDLMEEDPSSVDLDSFPVHVLTTVLKSFFREMPEPLMTYELYDDFIRACELSDFMERIQTIYIHLHKLPVANFDVLERLVFHLARVAQQEEYNRMSINALAIIFAPCILRTNKKLRVQDTLEDVGKQTLCIETILKKQLHQVRTTLADIDTLDAACHTATSRLSSLRSSKIFLLQENDNKSSNVENFEEEILTQHIENMQNEKVLLTTVLPSLWHTQEGSDDDLLSTDMDSNTGSVDDICSNQYSDTLSSGDPPAKLQPNNLKHLTKNRVLVPKRRLPSRFVHNSSQQDKNKMDESVVSFFHPQDVDQEEAIRV
ncbi:unconventional myosin-IXa-like [Centruroides sculpturatus]|uniref:unconventional myosin-IXa-like n=1 Tax=Centruroides sculpturatus TaxID=218467 RepID=UPI000C6E8B27|nr:unconventional myosin-IXa-like [Centruroides sculpturatus]